MAAALGSGSVRAAPQERRGGQKGSNNLATLLIHIVRYMIVYMSLVSETHKVLAMFSSMHPILALPLTLSHQLCITYLNFVFNVPDNQMY